MKKNRQEGLTQCQPLFEASSGLRANFQPLLAICGKYAIISRKRAK